MIENIVPIKDLPVEKRRYKYINKEKSISGVANTIFSFVIFMHSFIVLNITSPLFAPLIINQTNIESNFILLLV